jgi:hypothetical protein
MLRDELASIGAAPVAASTTTERLAKYRPSKVVASVLHSSLRWPHSGFYGVNRFQACRSLSQDVARL